MPWTHLGCAGRELIFSGHITGALHGTCSSFSAVFCVWLPALCLLSLPFPFPSPRSSQRKCSLGKPDQRELNENLAATQGLAHMIMECNRLFQVCHSLSPRKSSGQPGEGWLAWSSCWAMSLPAQQGLCSVPVTDGSPAAATRENECHCEHSSILPSIPNVMGLGDSLGLEDSLESTCGAVTAMCPGREALAIPAGEWVEVLLLGSGQSHSHGCAWPWTPVI